MKPKLEDQDTLRFRVALGNGTLGPYKWSLTINVDSRLIFVEIEGKRVSYDVQDMLNEGLELLIAEGLVKEHGV